MNLIEAFEKTKVSGFHSETDQIIESAISKLFFYGDRVLKVYKYEKYFFGDFSSHSFRKEFYQEDFRWNHAMAPRIYVALKGVKEIGDGYEQVNLDNAKDFYIEMKKIDIEKNLTNLLFVKQVSRADLEKIATEMTIRIRNLTRNEKEKLKLLAKKGCFDLLQEDLEDLRHWAYMADPKLPRIKSDELMNVLEKAFREEEYFKNFDSENLSIALDNHSDNIFLLNGNVEFLDIMPPKKNWRITDPYFNICRPAVDVMVIGTSNEAKVMYHAYEKIAPTVPSRVKTIYEIRSSIIRASYFYFLEKPDLAKKYLDFTEVKLQTL